MRTMRQIVEEKKRKMREGAKLAITFISTKTKERTPVLSGSARASWTPSIGPVVVRNIDTTLGGSARNNLAPVIAQLQIGQTFNFVNGQPYIKALEFDGHSPQTDGFTPNGMMRSSIVEWQQMVDRAIRESR